MIPEIIAIILIIFGILLLFRGLTESYEIEDVHRLEFINHLALSLIALSGGAELEWSMLKKRMKNIMALSVAQMAVIFIGVFSVFYLLFQSGLLGPVADSRYGIYAAIFLGVIATANSPSSVVAVINELNARGPLAQTALGVSVVKDEKTGQIKEIHCTYDPDSRGGSAPDGRKVKGTIHWVSAPHSKEAEVRLYDRLFTKADPSGDDYKKWLNPKSMEKLSNCRIEPALADAEPGGRFQFERLGYFCVDGNGGTEKRPVFNRTATLRDTWAKMKK